MFDHYSEKANVQHFFDVLLLVLIVRCFAVDTAICERGFSLMNMLKTARRSLMGAELLRSSMVICTLGSAWKDATQIPVKKIVEEWRAQGSKGRYDNQLWSADALQQAAADAKVECED